MNSLVLFATPFHFYVFLRALTLSVSLLLPAHCSVNVFFQASSCVFFLPDMIWILSLETGSCQDLLHASSPVLVVCAVFKYIHYICICMCLPDRPSPPPLLCCSLSACEMWCSLSSSCCGSCITSYTTSNLFWRTRWDSSRQLRRISRLADIISMTS